jgi:predicted transglutaminase-like cysteine proteinase
MKPTLSLVEGINTRVNADVRYRADAALYDIDEFWTVAEHEGDCEDYALAKRKLLTEQGYGDACRLATCWVETGEYHAVLVVTTDKGDYVLDNRHPYPMMRQDLPYKWHKIQEGSTWHVIS